MGARANAGEPTVSEFFAMGGYAGYVWPAFGLTFVVLAINYWSVVHQRKRAIASLNRKFKLEQSESAQGTVV